MVSWVFEFPSSEFFKLDSSEPHQQDENESWVNRSTKRLKFSHRTNEMKVDLVDHIGV